ncbi:phosphocholine-specific phospholipase C [Massilia sp. PAMC28688]|uniref:phosphocholine-specific phospholipase C n=1 Tax=Massilia sp. PAMC28688 TaxID=2861283 RepID=UPI001E3ACC2A|nr:phospholipase C, phosphocholine-specific [Massilia sp. PAMC28688]
MRQTEGGAGVAAAGTIMDVQHIVILMQENRSFDHYFGTLRGVRGFGDRFTIPVADTTGTAGSVWLQRNDSGDAVADRVAPFHLDTTQAFSAMRVLGTPHTWPNAQRAWDHGRLAAWPTFKQRHAMGHYTAVDLPYQCALADLFTVCDAYHCSLQAGTNPNRVMAWTGTNDPFQLGHGPVIGNSYDHLGFDPAGGYSWTTYPQRLQAAGVSWQIYQDLSDNYTDNPLVGFRAFRQAAAASAPDAVQRALRERALTTRTLDRLRQDVQDGTLPQVSYIIATAEGSEHPVPSSPAQGAAYTATVIDALASNPAVWSKTVLFLMFDENDGFFDHVPPPAVPSCLHWDNDPAKARFAGASTVSTAGEYHHLRSTEATEADDLMHRPYGLGPRVPMLVISPWSRGGWVNSQVFDHTSLIRFMEVRFGVMEPNISPWRRAVCGDLTSAFDFANPDPRPFVHLLPATAERAQRARQIGQASLPPMPAVPQLPRQAAGTRPSRALPYALAVHELPPGDGNTISLLLANAGRAGAVCHVYDRLRLAQVPRRYTVGAGHRLPASWDAPDGAYDLWILGPNGFHRHVAGTLAAPPFQVSVELDGGSGTLDLIMHNPGGTARACVVHANAYADALAAATPWQITLAPGQQARRSWPLQGSGGWYDFSVRLPELPGYVRRFAGRLETGRDSISDPAMNSPSWPKTGL